ncbi:ribonuclease H-like protein, partial [Lichtheimia hyalospora FSU 10163]
MTALKQASSRIRRELPNAWSMQYTTSRFMTTARMQAEALAATGTAAVNRDNGSLQQTQAEIEITKPTAAELNEIFNAMPPLSYPNHYKVECLSNPQTINKRISELVCQGDAFYGFDMEWQPQFKRGGKENKTALIQICGKDTILILQVVRLEYLPHQLVQFLKTKALLKSGVNIRGDGQKLARDFRVECNAFVDLDRICAFLYPQKPSRSLRSLTGFFLERNMKKHKKIQCSNWSRLALTPAQLKYAANDAYASYAIMSIFHQQLLAAGKSITDFVQHHVHEPSKRKTKEKIVIEQEKVTQQANVSSSFPSSTTTIIRKTTTSSKVTFSHSLPHDRSSSTT